MTLIHWTEQTDFPILFLLQVIPLLGLVIARLLKENKLVLPVSIVIATIELGLAVYLLHYYDQANLAMQFHEYLNLLGPVSYNMAVDGVSVLFILITSLISLLIIIYSRIRQLNPAPRFIILILAIQSSLISLFATIDLLWFSLVSLIQLILVSKIFDRWSTAAGQELSRKRFLQFMHSSLLLLFVAVFILGWFYANTNQGNWSFALQDLIRQKPDAQFASVTFLMMFIAFAIRTPIFPVHGWLPFIAEHGTVAVVGIYLIGIKAGVYGLFRFVLPIFSDTIPEWRVLIITIAIIGVFYAAVLALMQNNLRRLLAFAVISHSGLLIVGLFSLSHDAFLGTIMLSINFGIAITGMLFMMGLVINRTRTLQLSKLGGLFDATPFIGIVFFIAGLSIIGMPGTPGFDAAHLLFEAAIVNIGALPTIAMAVGNVATAGFLLWAFQRAFLAPNQSDNLDNLQATSRMEYLLGAIVLLILLGAGFYMEPWLELIDTSLQSVSNLYADLPMNRAH
jgi:NADH-quinone oxidoreductase subunit M